MWGDYRANCDICHASYCLLIQHTANIATAAQLKQTDNYIEPSYFDFSLKCLTYLSLWLSSINQWACPTKALAEHGRTRAAPQSMQMTAQNTVRRTEQTSQRRNHTHSLQFVITGIDAIPSVVCNKEGQAFRSTSSFTFHLRKECEYHLFHIAMKQTKTGHQKTTSTCWQCSQGKDRCWWYTQQHRYVPGEQLQPASVESLPV